MDIPSILVPYETDLEVYPSSLPDIGSHMKVLGRLPRHWEEYTPDYEDSVVRKWLLDRGEDLSYFDDFDVTIITREHARKALSRYDKPCDPFTPEVKRLYDVAEEWLYCEFGQYMSNSRVISSEAVENHLLDNKSPGIPWTLVGIHTKGDYFNEKCDFYCKYWDLLATPDYIRSLCSSSGKEEMRTAEKVRIGKIRSTISMEVSHVKAHCQLTLDQNEMLMKSVGKHSSYLGLVMQYGGWDRLNTRMSRFAPIPSTLELDGSEFDARYRWYCFQKVRNFRFRCLREMDRTPENWERLKNLYHELCFAPFVDIDGHVYSRSCGNPSGQACTTSDNIFKNFMDIVVLWHLIMPEKYHTYECFHELLVLCIVGDDINISVHPSIQHIFNMAAIKRTMHMIDMVYTTPCDDFRHNHDCEFLSHGFEEVMGMYLPVINCRKMRTSMLKFNTSGTLAETIIRACGLRNETFACVHCRTWFSELIDYLRTLPLEDGCETAWKSYKTDAELWALYTGYKYSDVCAALASAAGPPGYKFASVQNPSNNQLYLQSYRPTLVIVITGGGMTKTKKSAVKAAVKKIVKKAVKKTAKKSKRKSGVVRGKGGYWGDLGRHVVGRLGDRVDSWVKKVTGYGSYRVKKNSLMESGGPPSVHNNKHCFIIRHKEYLGDVKGSTGFNITSYPINPGVSTTFPWLSNLAQSFEQYEIDGMLFCYIPTSGSSINSTNPALGTVVLATEYNSNLPNFTNKIDMDNHEYTSTGKPSVNIMHPIECARSLTPIDQLYVRVGGSVIGYDPLLYDLGNFQIATTGCPADGNIIGELWCTYEIKFFKPCITNQNPSSDPVHYWLDQSAGQYPGTTNILNGMRNKATGSYAPNTARLPIPPGKWILVIHAVPNSGTFANVNFDTGITYNNCASFNFTADNNSGVAQASNFPSSNALFGNSQVANGTQDYTYVRGVDAGSSSIAYLSWASNIPTTGTGWANFDIYLFPVASGFAETRRAVDHDPIAKLYRRLNEMESRLSLCVDHDEEEDVDDCKYVCPPPNSPVLSRSTADLATSLLSRLSNRERAVTPKTAFAHAA